MAASQLFNQITTGQAELTPSQMRAYWGELDTLLARIECATDPYHVLGVEQAATYEEVWFSYQHHVALLYPSYAINAAFPDAMQTRIERTFAKVSRAFAVLASSGRRKKYDEAASLITGKMQTAELRQDPLSPEARARLAAEIAASAERMQQAIPSLSLTAAQVDVPSLIVPDNEEATTEEAPAENEQPLVPQPAGRYPRRFPRFKMRLPMRLTGYQQAGGAWQEEAETGQVSRMGALVRMRQRVRHGNVLHVSIPLPLKLRSYNFADKDYKAYAIVRSVIPRGDGVRDVGLEFLGKNPPMGYFDRPWDFFRTESWKGAERRRMPRFRISEKLNLEFFTDTRYHLSASAGVTETLSRGGACVRVAAMPEEFDLVGVACPDHGFESMAVVANRYAGQDGQDRLCLQFIEQQWPI